MGADHGIAPAGGEGGHVKRRAYIGATGFGSALAALLAAVLVERRHPHQCCDLSARGLAQLGQFVDQRAGGLFADAVDAFKFSLLLLGFFIGFGRLIDLLIELGDLLVDRRDRLRNTMRDGWIGCLMPAVTVGSAHLDQLPKPDIQPHAFFLISVGFGVTRGLHVMAEPGDKRRVDLVSLGQHAPSYGILAHPFRVHDGHRQVMCERRRETLAPQRGKPMQSLEAVANGAV